MKEFLIVGGMALAVYLLMGGKVGKPQTYSADYGNTTLIMEVAGWKYYSDGSVIGPDGAYYFQGSQVTGPQQSSAYAPAAAQGNGIYL